MKSKVQLRAMFAKLLGGRKGKKISKRLKDLELHTKLSDPSWKNARASKQKKVAERLSA